MRITGFPAAMRNKEQSDKQKKKTKKKTSDMDKWQNTSVEKQKFSHRIKIKLKKKVSLIHDF